MTIQKKSEHPFSDKYESPSPSMGQGGGQLCIRMGISQNKFFPSTSYFCQIRLGHLRILS